MIKIRLANDDVIEGPRDYVIVECYEHLYRSLAYALREWADSAYDGKIHEPIVLPAELAEPILAEIRQDLDAKPSIVSEVECQAASPIATT